MRFRGGGSQRRKAVCSLGYSASAQRTGKTRSYLKPIRNSLQNPIEGRSSQRRNRQNRTEQRADLKPNSQSMQKTRRRVSRQTERTQRTYLHSIRGSLHRPTEGEAENVGGEVAIGAKTVQKHGENHTANPSKNPTSRL